MTTYKRYLATGIVFAMAAALILLGLTASAQTSSATLTGTVYDTSGAVVPGATVLLRNQQSGDTRREISNPEGYFTFAAVPPATYSVTVEKQGFVKWEGRGITLDSNDNRAVAGIKLKAGSQEQTVIVQASSGQITPTDSGEKSFTIDEKIMQNVAIIGQNAAEFIKIMPGMAYTGGALNQSSYQATDERTGNGPVGSFSANGQRTGALDITSDGAHIIDPGCNCGQAMNTNQEMTQEVTVLTSNFGADSAKGPVVINTVGKSGGQQFHGEAYIYARYYALNANDWLGNSAGVDPNTGKQLAPRPETKYWYPGAQVGGPLFIPGTSFNKNHDKLFFFFATEYYKQNVDNGIYRAAVPTQSMRNGDFTQPDSDLTYLKELSGGAIQGVPTGKAFTCTQYIIQNNNKVCAASMINPGYADPSGKGMIGVYPLPNANPESAGANNGFNYINSSTRFSNMLQFRGRIDASINDSTKFFVSYNRQTDSAEESLDTLWTGNAQSWDDPTTPYPSPIVESTVSDVVTASMTKIFNPTLTNEVIFNFVYLNLPNKFQDPSKVARGTLGINYSMLFPHDNVQNLIYPEMTGWGNGISNQLNTGFELGGVVYAKKTLPSVADNISKVWKTHTAKFGFYWERTWNEQPGNGAVNGTAVYSNWGSGSSGNAYADMLIGQTTQYSELNYNVVPAFRYIATEFYGMDSWKASRRLTVDYGLRVSHLGPWIDTTGYGFAAWYPDAYAAGQGGSVNGQTFPGIYWNKVHSSTSLAGSGSRLFFYNPRVGLAWDVKGNGDTILRGGYGIYHFHDEQNVQNPAYSIVRGSFSSQTLNGPQISNLPQTGSAFPGGVTTLQPSDDEEPRTQSWSVTVAQRAPWRSLFELSYLGSKSDYLSNWNNNFGNINDLNVGALTAQYGWLPDCYPKGNPPTDGGACAASGADTGYNSGNTQSARPYQPYSSIKITNHQMYSNYNAMQVTWNKQQGHFIFLANYTFSKALGIRGENGAPAGNPLNLRDNYGTLPNNRTHIFNLAYVYQFPNVTSDNSLLKAVANNWQISGISQWQSGADIQAAVTSNFNYIGFIPAGTTYQGRTIDKAIQATNQNVLGTPDITLMPKVICNPRASLHANQYINGNCFAPFATPGQQGTYIFPTLEGPAYSGNDLSVFKNFTFGQSEAKKLQFRFSGYNFLNHPIRTFTNGDQAFNLTFNSSGQLQQPVPGVDFGTAYSKIGHRIIQGEMKFTF
ncbi:MAG TPA: carboxypeptidase-like regulatory domain-containing protein [Silvibacterium sp.]|nr:carboxypeptidase-like regulatory domain-containing protein [Silvibacterium sp.]